MASDGNNELTSTLERAQMGDPQAAQTLDKWKAENFAEFAFALATEIGAASHPLPARQLAGVFLKNMLNAKAHVLIQQNVERWKAVDREQRGRIKAALLQSMASPEPMAPHMAAMAAAEIAAIELPHNEWNEFVPTLMERWTGANVQDAVKLATLECLGYTADRVNDIEEVVDQPELSTHTVDKMLTAIIDGLQPARDDKLRTAAITALKNSIYFVRKNMENKTERDVIFNAIFGATQGKDSQLRELAFGTLDQIADIYYEMLPDHMAVIFQLTTAAIKGDPDETVKTAAIEFWSTVANVESDLLADEQDNLELNRPLNRPPCPKYVQSAIEGLVPILVECLTHQDEHAEEDQWNVQMATGVCLEAISATVESLIVPVVMPFVQNNITSQNWRYRDAAIVAFSCILDGPATEVIAQYVNQAVPVLLNSFSDQSPMVRENATFCISNICKFHMEAVSPDQLTNIMRGLHAMLKEKPRLAGQACTAIYNIAEGYKPSDGEIPQTNALSAYMFEILKALLQSADRHDAFEANLSISAFSAASQLVRAAAMDVREVLRNFLPEVLTRLNNLLRAPADNREQKDHKESLLGLLSDLMGTVATAMGKTGFLPLADECANTLLQVLQFRDAACFEDAMFTVGTVADLLEDDFAKYVDTFMPHLLYGLQSIQSEHLCVVSVGVAVAITGAVGKQIVRHCDNIMKALQLALTSEMANRDIKPYVISSFGDIALAIGQAFEPYLQACVMMLMQASQQMPTPGDELLVDFINSLRAAVLDAYSGIVVGLAEENTIRLFVPHVPALMQFLHMLSTPQSQKNVEVLWKAVGLLGDVAKEMGSESQVKQHLQEPFVAMLVREAAAAEDDQARTMANWASSVIQPLIQAG